LKETKLYLYGIVSGLLLALSFPPMPFGNLAVIALVPLLFILEYEPKRPFLLLYLTFFVYHAGTNWWISSWQVDTDPYLMISGIAVALIHPFFFIIPFAPYLFIKKRIGTQKALWFLPFFWVAFEWLHSIGDPAYPWLSLGYTQIYNTYWVQFADITGNWGISFAIVLFNIMILKLAYVYRTLDKEERRIKQLFKHPQILKFLIPLLLLLLIPNVYGAFRYHHFTHEKMTEKYQTVSLGIVQPSINPWNKWESSASQQIFKHTQLSDSLAKALGPPDAFIWSETAILFMGVEMNAGHNFSMLHRWLDMHNSSLISGFADMYFYKPGEDYTVAAKPFRGDTNLIYDSYNSMLVLNSPETDESNPQIYHKMRLTPFGERIPFLEIFSFARKWLEWGVGISNWAKGTEQKVLKIKTKDNKEFLTAPVICIESLYPDFVRKFINQGADFITIITNDAWYDHTFGPEQHYQIAVMRAIETRRYVARCANTGVSGFIQANGETLLRAPQYQSIAVGAAIPAIKEKSLYLIYGEWVVYLSLLISLYAIVLGFVKQK